ncbi:hypothetical protein LguiB_011527 [Lonicera macranthoides]
MKPRTWIHDKQMRNKRIDTITSRIERVRGLPQPNRLIVFMGIFGSLPDGEKGAVF